MWLQYRHLLELRMSPKECPHKQSTEQSLSCLVSVLKSLSQALTKDLILSPSHMENECTLQVVLWFSSAAAQPITPATASERCAGSQFPGSRSCSLQAWVLSAGCHQGPEAPLCRLSRFSRPEEQHSSRGTTRHGLRAGPRAATPTQPRCSFALEQNQIGLQGLRFLKRVCSPNTSGNTPDS